VTAVAVTLFVAVFILSLVALRPSGFLKSANNMQAAKVNLAGYSHDPAPNG